MKLSRTVAYAVQATMQLAEANSNIPVPCSRMAAEGKMPERFLLQILRHLVTHGVLHSTRGVDGGYALVRKPEQITLLEIIEAIDGPLNSAMPSGDGISPQSLGRLREVIKEVTESVRKQLQAIKLSDLMGENKKSRRT